MSWVVMGILGGPIVRLMHQALESYHFEYIRVLMSVWGILGGPIISSISPAFESYHSRYFKVLMSNFVLIVYFGAPAIGGMVVVGLMIQDYGVCRLLT
jgi:hypothetical protein